MNKIKLSIKEEYISGKNNLLDFLAFIVNNNEKGIAYQGNILRIKSHKVKKAMIDMDYEYLEKKMNTFILGERYFLQNYDLEEILSSIDYEPFESSHVKIFFQKIFGDKIILWESSKMTGKKYYYSNMLTGFLQKFTNINEVIPYRKDQIKNVQIEYDMNKSNLLYFFQKGGDFKNGEYTKGKSGRIQGKLFYNNLNDTSTGLHLTNIFFRDDLKDLNYIYN